MKAFYRTKFWHKTGEQIVIAFEPVCYKFAAYRMNKDGDVKYFPPGGKCNSLDGVLKNLNESKSKTIIRNGDLRNGEF